MFSISCCIIYKIKHFLSELDFDDLKQLDTSDGGLLVLGLYFNGRVVLDWYRLNPIRCNPVMRKHILDRGTLLRVLGQHSLQQIEKEGVGLASSVVRPKSYEFDVTYSLFWIFGYSSCVFLPLKGFLL
jgi:hypothetical protein